MSLDPFSLNLKTEKGSKENLQPELIAARKDVIETTKRNLSPTTGSALEDEYVTKAYRYAKKFVISPGLINDLITEGKTEFESEEALARWADSLPLPPS